LGPIPNPQSPIPKSIYHNDKYFKILLILKNKKINKKIN